MEFGRLIIMTDGDRFCFIRRTWLTKIFVIGDILSFLAQFSGAQNSTFLLWHLSKIFTDNNRWCNARERYYCQQRTKYHEGRRRCSTFVFWCLHRHDHRFQHAVVQARLADKAHRALEETHCSTILHRDIDIDTINLSTH
jgi:hypothetical protein